MTTPPTPMKVSPNVSTESVPGPHTTVIRIPTITRMSHIIEV